MSLILKKILGTLWAAAPPFLRMKIVRTTQQKFTVSVAAMIINKKGELLLLNHTLRPRFNWGIPGGFINYGEQPEASLRRELREETGLELEDIEMIRVRTINRHVEILFRARAEGKVEIRSHEITDAGWFRLDNLPDEVSAVQREMIRNFFESGF